MTDAVDRILSPVRLTIPPPAMEGVERLSHRASTARRYPPATPMPGVETVASKGDIDMRIVLASVMVNDQSKALTFYTEVLGFVKKDDIPMGDARWLTIVSPEDSDGTQLVLEPDDNPVIDGAAQSFKQALYEAQIPAASFAVHDVQAEYGRMKLLGVRFTMNPTQTGPAMVAVLDDTCGNLIQIHEHSEK